MHLRQLIVLCVVLSLSTLCLYAQDTSTLDISILGVDKRPTEFYGVGFHAFFPVHTEHVTPEIEQVLHRRWRELNPSFVRVTHNWGWDEDFAVRQMEMMKSTGTKIYLTTWNPENLSEAADIKVYGEKTARMLENLVINRKLDNIRWYCMTNELSLPGKWAAMAKDMPKFESYHRAIYKAMTNRKVPLGLLASDASPTWQWNTISWAQENMDEVTQAYGGHHYINKQSPDDLEFYSWFHDQVKTIATASHKLGKPFIIGEFGPKQHRGPRYGFEKWDGCAYFDTPQENMAALQTAEAVIAAVNGGADAIAYWTFADFPDEYSANKKYANKWGVFRWDKGFTTRPVYYAVGLMTKFFRGPSDVYKTVAPENIRALTIRNRQSGKFRTAIINRSSEAVHVNLNIASNEAIGEWDIYVFNPSDAEKYCKAGPLLNNINSLKKSAPAIATIPPQSLVVFVQK